jgi:hypothetical protein
MGRDGAVLPQLLAAGEPPPDWSIEPPRGRWDDFYRAAFYDLETERPNNGWSIGPIPHSRILAYGQHAGLVGPTLDAFVYVIRQMDAAHLAWMRAEEAKRTAAP